MWIIKQLLTFHLGDKLLFWSHLMIKLPRVSKLLGSLSCLGHCSQCHLTNFLWSECFLGISQYRLIQFRPPISGAERWKESKCWGFLTLVIIFLYNQHFTFPNILYCRQYLTLQRRWIFTIVFCLTWCLVWRGNRKFLKSYTDVFIIIFVICYVWVMYLIL